MTRPSKITGLKGIVALALLVAPGCGGGDDGGGDGSGGVDGGGGGAGCEGAVSGDVAGAVSGCVTAVNHYPDGYTDPADPHFIYSLVAAPETGSELEAPLESLGINLFIAGDPAPGTYGLADALPSTDGFVYAPYPTAFEDLTTLTLTIDDLTQVTEMDDQGYRLVSYQVSGSFEMTLEDGAGGAATVSVSF